MWCSRMQERERHLMRAWKRIKQERRLLLVCQPLLAAVSTVQQECSGRTMKEPLNLGVTTIKSSSVIF